MGVGSNWKKVKAKEREGKESMAVTRVVPGAQPKLAVRSCAPTEHREVTAWRPIRSPTLQSFHRPLLREHRAGRTGPDSSQRGGQWTVGRVVAPGQGWVHSEAPCLGWESRVPRLALGCFCSQPRHPS